MHGIGRVLRPTGRLIFYEISVSPEEDVHRWQRRWEPIHRAMFAGLYLTRDIPAHLTQAGFRIERVETGYVARFPKSWSHCCWGAATPPSRLLRTVA